MLFIILCFAFIFVFIAYSASCIPAAADSLIQCITVVIPSIYPFLVITEMLNKTDFFYLVGNKLDKLSKKLFNISGNAVSVILIGYLCGFPGAAKITSDLYANKKISYEDAIRLSVFTNNPGPLFVIGTIGYGFLNSVNLGIKLFILQILSSLLTGLILNRFIKLNKINFIKKDDLKHNIKSSVTLSSISDSITGAFFTMIPITATIVFFASFSEAIISSNIIVPIVNLFKLDDFTDVFNSSIKCFFEITGGLSSIIPIIKKSKLLLPVISLICGWSGISIHMQIISFYSKAGIETKYYFAGKIFNMVLVFLTSLFFISL
ncbi:MAG: hypothetical protein IJZ94_03120 [Clostridia bacterium]|nr:hypothetical protein [Clostridia bacterium]